MKTNIIHILIIVIIFISGWSLFTVMQDFYSTDALKQDTYSVINKTKLYLPLTPEDYSNQRIKPSGKLNPAINGQIDKANISKENNITLNEEFVNYNIQAGNGLNQSVAGGKKQSKNFSPKTKTSSLRKMDIFKKNNYYSKRDIADASVSTVINGSSKAGSDGMMKVFGNDKEGDAIVGGSGNNNFFYNDVPVGEGTYILIFMSFLYLLFKKINSIATDGTISVHGN